MPNTYTFKPCIIILFGEFMAREKETFDRYLKYKAKHTGWYIFRSLYWAIYFIAIGIVQIAYGNVFPAQDYLGFVLVLFGLMLAIYGLVENLHHKLMERYA